jgi:adenylate kinase
MMNLVFFGPPGSGKGTQAEIIASEMELKHISTGDIFRKNIKEKTELGVMAQAYMKEGKLVPDQLTINLLSNELDMCQSSKGFIFDGFPRTLPQAKSFDKLLSVKDIPISLVISLEVSENELVYRLLERGKVSGRVDDQDENIIRNRIQVYNKETSILKDYYVNTINECFISMNGEQNVDIISEEILLHIKNFRVNSHKL